MGRGRPLRGGGSSIGSVPRAHGEYKAQHRPQAQAHRRSRRPPHLREALFSLQGAARPQRGGAGEPVLQKRRLPSRIHLVVLQKRGEGSTGGTEAAEAGAREAGHTRGRRRRAGSDAAGGMQGRSAGRGAAAAARGCCCCRRAAAGTHALLVAARPKEGCAGIERVACARASKGRRSARARGSREAPRIRPGSGPAGRRPPATRSLRASKRDRNQPAFGRMGQAAPLPPSRPASRPRHMPRHAPNPPT